MNKQTILNVLLLALIVALLWFHSCKTNKLNQEIALSKAASDTLIKKRNSDGSQTATIELMQADNIEMFLDLKSKDSIIKKLQDEVRKNKSKIRDGGSITIVDSETTYSSTTTSTVSFNPGDSCNPIYSSSSMDSTWIKYSIRASKDSTLFKLKVKNRYSILIGREKIGFMKYRPIVEVTNQNPYTDTKSLRAFEVKDTRPKQRISLGIQAGYGITLKGLSPYIGLGANFKIL